MADVKWIKIVTDIFDDEKILLIDSLPERDSIIVIWLKLLCIAGKQNNGGVLMMNERIAYTDEMLATIFRRPLSSVRLALSIFEQYGMIEIVNNAVTIPKWEYHQNIDGLQKIKEQTKERVRKYRERQKQQSVACNVTETCCNDTDKKRTDKNRTDKNRTDMNSEDETKTQKRFRPPSLEEVTAYCMERNNSINPEKFFNYYEANGWKIGRAKMKDWKACIRSWESNGFNDNKNQNNTTGNIFVDMLNESQLGQEVFINDIR